MFTDAPCSSQLILGIDRRNPLFAVYEDSDKEQLHVYYGFELLEIVPNQFQAPAFKMLAGRLYNAGLKVQSLREVFQVDRKTLQRWGRALQSGDAQELIRVLAGRSAARKLTPAIEAFARKRWLRLSAQGAYGSSRRLRQEIHEIFEVDLSAETLRPLVQELKAGTGPVVPEEEPEEGATTVPPEAPVEKGLPSQAVAAECPVENQPPREAVAPEKRETPCDCEVVEAEGDCPSNTLALKANSPRPVLLDNPKESPVLLSSACCVANSSWAGSSVCSLPASTAVRTSTPRARRPRTRERDEASSSR